MSINVVIYIVIGDQALVLRLQGWGEVDLIDDGALVDHDWLNVIVVKRVVFCGIPVRSRLREANDLVDVIRVELHNLNILLSVQKVAEPGSDFIDKLWGPGGQLEQSVFDPVSRVFQSFLNFRVSNCINGKRTLSNSSEGLLKGFDYICEGGGRSQLSAAGWVPLVSLILWLIKL